jgi:hypothetical protein
MLLQRDSRDFDLEWMTLQFGNMVKALAAVHDVSRIGNPQLPRFRYLQRAHLQYDNFLCIGRPERSSARLVLSDLSDVLQNMDISLMAPECKQDDTSSRTRKGNIGNAVHIWSLGAIWLDMIIWLLKGPDEVTAFWRIREPGFHFEKAGNTQDSPTVVAPVVLELIARLKSMEDCPTYIDSLLDIIQHGMLVIDPRERLSAQELVDILDLTLEITQV